MKMKESKGPRTELWDTIYYSDLVFHVECHDSQYQMYFQGL